MAVDGPRRGAPSASAVGAGAELGPTLRAPPRDGARASASTRDPGLAAAAPAPRPTALEISAHLRAMDAGTLGRFVNELSWGLTLRLDRRRAALADAMGAAPEQAPATQRRARQAEVELERFKASPVFVAAERELGRRFGQPYLTGQNPGWFLSGDERERVRALSRYGADDDAALQFGIEGVFGLGQDPVLAFCRHF